MLKKLTKLVYTLLVVTTLFGCGAQQVKPVEEYVPPAVQKTLVELSAAKYQSALDLLKSGQLSEAKIAFTELQKTVKDSPGLYTNLGVISEAEEKMGEAETYYNEALSHNPFYSDALNNLGAIYVQRGDFQKAKQFYEKGLQSDKTHPKLLLNLAMLNELYLHNLSEALDLYGVYVANYPDSNKQVSGWMSDLKRRLK